MLSSVAQGHRSSPVCEVISRSPLGITVCHNNVLMPATEMHLKDMILWAKRHNGLVQLLFTSGDPNLDASLGHK